MKTRIIATAVVSLAVGLVLGRSCLAPRGPAGAESGPAVQKAEAWTCSMHPQVRLPRAGQCPICEMPLIPAGTAQTGSGAAPMLQLSDHALAMARIEVASVERRELARELRAVGKVRYNESALATITARIDGYAERLFVDFTGVEIKSGEHLAEIYSPELLIAEMEFRIAAQGAAGPASAALVETGKAKLARWGMTPAQIDALLTSNAVTDRVTLFSPINGTVIEKNIVLNSAFKAGDALYRVVNLDTVWVYLEIYEYDLAWVRYGQRVGITVEGLPGRVFEGTVTFVEPVVDEATRTIRVPVHVSNPDHALKPGMFVSAVIRARLGADGTVASTGIEGKFACTMHPQFVLDSAGACVVCGMPLSKVPGDPVANEARGTEGAPPATAFFCPMKCEGEKTYPGAGKCPVCEMRLEPVSARKSGPGVLAVPASAVLDSGTRRLVYVEKSRGLFEPREVVLGPRAGDFFPVLRGVEEGERVATRGGFLIDSQFQVTGHPSLFYPGGLVADPAPAADGAVEREGEHEGGKREGHRH